MMCVYVKLNVQCHFMPTYVRTYEWQECTQLNICKTVNVLTEKTHLRRFKHNRKVKVGCKGTNRLDGVAYGF